MRLWKHLSFFNAAAGRVEMHLVSKIPQTVRVLGETHLFDADERIHTENSYKFSDEQVRAIATESGFRIEKCWTDERGWFSLVLLS